MVSDKTRRSEFIEQNLGLVHACAGRFRGRGIEYDDLYSAGCMGLIKATDGFDAARGVCFSTYAVPVILGEIKKLFRDGGTVKVSRSLKELGMKINAARERHRKLTGTEPALSQLAEELGESIENVTLALQAAQPAPGGQASDPAALLCKPHPERDCQTAAYDPGADLPAGAEDPETDEGKADGGVKTRKTGIFWRKIEKRLAFCRRLC